MTARPTALTPAELDAARMLLARLGITRLSLPVAAALVWGRPLRP